MDPFTIGSLILGGAQAVGGMFQRKAARKRRDRAMGKLDYDIPSAVTETVRAAKERASLRGLPGEDITRARAESDLAETVSRGEAVAESASDLLGLYAKAYGQKSDLSQRLLEGGAQYQAQRDMELDRAMNLMAEAQGQQFHYNRYVPFMAEMGYAGQQAQGGAANIAGGLQTAYQSWANDWMMGKMMDMNESNVDPINLPRYDWNQFAGGGGGGGFGGYGGAIPLSSNNFGRGDLTPYRTQFNAPDYMNRLWQTTKPQ